jgi:plastocyanin
VSIASFSFQPAALTVSVGTTVTWTNNDSANHTVTADDGAFTSGTLGTGGTFSQTFATAGTFAYHCSLHSSMKGTITVQ